VLIDVAVDRRVTEYDNCLADFGAGLENELLTEPAHRTAPRVLIHPYVDLRGGTDRQRHGGHGQPCGERPSHSRHECTAPPKATWLSAVPNATHARNITATTANAYTASGSTTACHTTRAALSIASACCATRVVPVPSPH